MPSRVAAVKAPRTHNRRRVTGSSGRRREGGESEPQRPDMSRHLFHFVLLLLVVMAFGGSGTVNADDEEHPADPQFKWKGITDDEKLDSLGAPSLLKVGSDVFAVAEAQCKKGGGNSFTGIASQLLTTKTTNTPEEVLEKPKDETQVLEEGASEEQKKKVDVSRPTTVLKGNDIYMLVGQYGSKDSQNSGAGGCGLLLVKGSVSGEGPSNNKIVWKDTESPPQRLFDAQPDSWTRLIGSGGSGVRIKDGTFLFPVEGTKKKGNEDADEDGKTVSLIISSSQDFTDWKLSKGMSADGCGAPSVVEWEKGKLMMITACDGGRRRVYESGDKGEEWTEALGTLSRVWGNKKDVSGVRSGFITATIDGVKDNRNVMLLTLPVYSKEGKEKGKLHLWLTDNTHIVDIGPVSDDDAAASSLLYKSGTGDNKEELIALYEKKKNNEETSSGMVSVLLTEQLERVKKVLATWKEVDERVSKLCTTLLAAKDPPTGTACGPIVKITDGLVGFLSGIFSDGIWRDEYLGVNATAEDDAAAATGPSDGVKFTGRGAGAQWPVGKQGENQLYHFANYKFTLVATVSIHGEPEGSPIPVMGVRAGSKGETKLIELSYDNEKKWRVLCCDGNSKELSSIGETDTAQHVVILLRNGTQCTAYVDGQRVGDAQCELGSGESNEISHFYIGGDGENAEKRGDASVTVTNVLLYNRPWDEAEITALNPNKAPAPSPVNGPSQETAIENSPGGGKEEQGQLLGSSGTGVISTPTVSTITAPSAGEESVMQVVSGSSSDGSKNVGGGSFSDGDPTVETREEGTNGQEEEVNTQVRELNATAVSSSLENVSQGNNSDGGSVCGSGLLPSLLLLLGLWGFAAL
ncbi:putative trans-sialidase, Group V [Trypanosoma cruzi]|nr:putative trans-sialidase, Group V [Trypanosoma cruzi]